jgi:hypothetical protein
MKNNNTKQIVNYSMKLSISLSKLDRKSVLDIAYDTAAIGSSIISNTSRVLNENK